MESVVEGFPLSPQQRRAWQGVQRHGGAGVVQAGVRLSAGDGAGVRAALGRLVDRHEILRTVFRCLPGMDEPLQVVLDPAAIEPEHRGVEWSEHRGVEWSEHRGVDDIAAHCARLRRRPFDLENGPLLRADLVHPTAGGEVLVLTLPALCCDAPSLRLLAAQLAQELAAGASAASADEEELQYADLAAWFNELLQAEETAPGREHWQALELSGVQPATVEAEFTPCFLRLAAPLQLPPEIDAAAFLLACWQGVLQRRGIAGLGSEQPGVLGFAADGRKFAELEAAIGPLTRVVPLPPLPATARTLAQALAGAADSVARAVRFQDACAWQDLDLPSYLPVCLFLETLQPATEGGLQPEPAADYGFAERFELLLHGRLQTTAAGCRVELELGYDGARFDAAAAARLRDALACWMDAALAAATRTPAGGPATAATTLLSELPCLGAAEWQQLCTLAGAPGALAEAALAQAALPAVPAGVVERFGQAVRLHQQQPAVRDGSDQLTYGELARRVRRLARHLRAAGVGAEVVVGLAAERRVETLLVLLAILEAGGAYLPLDPALPQARHHALLHAAGARFVVGRDLPALPPEVDVIDLQAQAAAIAARDSSPLDLEIDPRQLAYVLFTSGSTGQPKGVAVEHRQLAAYVAAAEQRLDFGPPGEPGGTFALVSSLAADLGNTMIFPALCRGGCLLVVPEATISDASALAELCTAAAVDHLKIVPGHLQALLEAPGAERVLPRRRLVCGGEALPPRLLERVAELAPRTRVFNHYGPTETTVGVAAAEMAPGDPVSLGRPLPGCQLWLVDRHLRPVALGAKGEILVGGAQLARGYAGRPAATAARFVPDALGTTALGTTAGGRLYRTGDLGRLRGDGAFEFLGRTDNQVKIRGYRVELGEVESALRRLPGVRAAAALLRREGPAELVGYVHLDSEVHLGDTARTPAELRERLAAELPDYMVPAVIVPLESWPRTANGKLDRAALPAPPRPNQAAHERPRTPVEEQVTELWRTLFEREQIGLDDDFFALGGHSLLAMQLTARLRQALGVELAVDQVFQAPTPRLLARAVSTALSAQASSAGGVEVAPPIERRPEGVAIPLSFAQERHWFLQQLDPASPLYNIRGALRVKGPLDLEVLRTCFERLVERHEVLRTAFPNTAAGPRQEVVVTPPMALPLVDFQHFEAAAEDLAMGLVTRLGLEPFDLCQPPLLRLQALRLAPREHLLVITLHHIVADRWALGLLQRELAALYPALVAGRPSPLPPLPVQYADYAHWQRGWLRDEVLEHQLDWWRRELAGAPPLLELPFARARPARLSGRSGRWPFLLDAETAARLKQLGRAQGATFFQTLLALFQLQLQGLVGADDVVVGSPVAGRGQAETEDLVGCFINALALRARFAEDPTFPQLLAQVRESLLGAYRHAHLPFERLVQELNPERQAGAAPVFQVVFNYADAPVAALDFAGLSWTPLRPESVFDAKYDLVLAMFDSPEGVRSFLIYSLDLFDASAMTRMAEQLCALAARLVEHPEARVSELTAALRRDEQASRRDSAERLRQQRGKKLAAARRRTVR